MTGDIHLKKNEIQWFAPKNLNFILLTMDNKSLIHWLLCVRTSRKYIIRISIAWIFKKQTCHKDFLHTKHIQQQQTTKKIQESPMENQTSQNLFSIFSDIIRPSHEIKRRSKLRTRQMYNFRVVFVFLSFFSLLVECLNSEIFGSAHQMNDYDRRTAKNVSENTLKRLRLCINVGSTFQ